MRLKNATVSRLALKAAGGLCGRTTLCVPPSDYLDEVYRI
jgi:hypothetical protein